VSGVPYHAWTHRPKAQGGTDPVSFSSTEVAILAGWESISTGDITTSTWTDVNADGFYNDGYSSSSDMIYDLDTGLIQMPDAKLHWAVGWIQTFGGFSTGDILAVALNLGSSFRVINSIVCGASGVLGDLHLQVAGPIWAGIGGANRVHLEVWHNHGSAITLQDAQLTVAQLATLDPTLWTVHA
jgi:hypothetical protein